MTNQENHIIDAKGLICPEPIMMLHAAIRDAQENEIILLIATDPAAERDVNQFCQFLSHELIQTEKNAAEDNKTVWTFKIRKKPRD